MKKFFNRYILWLILVISLLCISNVKWGSDRWKTIVAFDGKGYYAYLPAIFIYHDLQFNFHDTIEKKYYSERTFYEYRVKTPSGMTDKYYSGTAFVMMPFFLASNLITKMKGGDADGYSFYYQMFVSLAALFYALAGLYFMRKFLKLYFISDNIITLVTIAIFFGTQLFNYTLFDPSYSHVYSFAFITWFLFVMKKFSLIYRKKDLINSGILFGIICLIRPVNALIILIIPFLTGTRENFQNFLRMIFKKNSGLALALISFILIFSLQFILYFIQTGKFFIDTYTVEHFIWSRPEMINILFSYKKGLFVYTPLAFISLFGLIQFYKIDKFSFWSFILFFLIVTYVFSCWWSWWYGGSFSSRPYTEYLSLFALLLGVALTSAKRKLQSAVFYSTILFCIILCQIQTYQYRYFVIHWDKMDKEHYWRVFMRIDQVMKNENANKDLLL